MFSHNTNPKNCSCEDTLNKKHTVFHTCTSINAKGCTKSKLIENESVKTLANNSKQVNEFVKKKKNQILHVSSIFFKSFK